LNRSIREDWTQFRTRVCQAMWIDRGNTRAEESRSRTYAYMDNAGGTVVSSLITRKVLNVT